MRLQDGTVLQRQCSQTRGLCCKGNLLYLHGNEQLTRRKCKKKRTFVSSSLSGLLFFSGVPRCDQKKKDGNAGHAHIKKMAEGR